MVQSIAFSAVVIVTIGEREYRVDLLSEYVESAVYLSRGRGVTWRKVTNKGKQTEAILRASDQWHAENPGQRLATGAELRASGYHRKAGLC